MSVEVFWEDAWHTVELPKSRDVRVWSAACEFVFGLTWIAALKHGKDAWRAGQLAEAAVFKRLYPGVVFDRALEGDLRKISRKEHEGPEH
jgi:hypothetical protein